MSVDSLSIRLASIDAVAIARSHGLGVSAAASELCHSLLRIDVVPNSVIVKRKVLFGDCDPEGIVYTPRFSYFVIEAVHDALSVWLSGPGLRTLLGFDLLPPARAFSLEFLHPVTWDDELSMTVTVSNVSLHSFTFAVEGNLAPAIKAFTASLAHVCVSPVTKEIIEVPQALRALLAPDECRGSRETAGG